MGGGTKGMVIEKFFDEIPYEPLLDAVAERVADGSVSRLVRLFGGRRLRRDAGASSYQLGKS